MSCRSSYKRYKDVCLRVEDYITRKSLISFNPETPLEEEEPRLLALLRDLKRCRRGREGHRDRCIPLADQDIGHERQIEILEQLETEAEIALQDLYTFAETMGEVEELEELVEPELPEDIPPSNCFQASTHRDKVCSAVSRFDLNLAEITRISPLEVDEQYRVIRSQLIDCYNSSLEEQLACGVSDFDFTNFSQSILKPLKDYSKRATEAYGEHQSIMTRYLDTVRKPEIQRLILQALKMLSQLRRKASAILQNLPYSARLLRVLKKAGFSVDSLADLTLTEIGYLDAIKAHGYLPVNDLNIDEIYNIIDLIFSSNSRDFGYIFNLEVIKELKTTAVPELQANYNNIITRAKNKQTSGFITFGIYEKTLKKMYADSLRK